MVVGDASGGWEDLRDRESVRGYVEKLRTITRELVATNKTLPTPATVASGKKSKYDWMTFYVVLRVNGGCHYRIYSPNYSHSKNIRVKKLWECKCLNFTPFQNHTYENFGVGFVHNSTLYIVWCHDYILVARMHMSTIYKNMHWYA